MTLERHERMNDRNDGERRQEDEAAPNRAVPIAIRRVKEAGGSLWKNATIRRDVDMSDNRIRSHECEGFPKGTAPFLQNIPERTKNERQTSE